MSAPCQKRIYAVSFVMPEVQLQSCLTCPKCGHRSLENMPTNACVISYVCDNCHERLKPLPDDCGVYGA